MYSQGDICLIDFNPTIGEDITKIRPAVIISGDFSTGLGLKIVVPVTNWKSDFEKIWWLFRLLPTKQNGLDKESTVNCYQMRCVSDIRIIRKLGNVGKDIEEIIATCQNCLEI